MDPARRFILSSTEEVATVDEKEAVQEAR